jgi:hypothetical protein
MIPIPYSTPGSMAAERPSRAAYIIGRAAEVLCAMCQIWVGRFSRRPRRPDSVQRVKSTAMVLPPLTTTPTRSLGRGA